MRVLGQGLLLLSGLQLVVGVVMFSRGFTALIQSVLALLTGVLTLRVAWMFGRVVATDQRPLDRLADALEALRDLYQLQTALVGLAFLAFVVVLVALTLSGSIR
jgi:hypothetical protein